MLTTFLILLVLLIILVAVIARRPDTFRVTRSAVISAPVPVVFEQVNNLHLWQAWSPWAKLDPAAVNTFEGPPAGSGAIFRWSGNKKVGAGSMTITESRPEEFIAFQVDFLRPFVGTNNTEFTFRPEGERTAMSWSMFGRNNFMAKAVGFFLNCEKMVGGQFERGLANLEAVVAARSSFGAPVLHPRSRSS